MAQRILNNLELNANRRARRKREFVIETNACGTHSIFGSSECKKLNSSLLFFITAKLLLFFYSSCHFSSTLSLSIHPSIQPLLFLSLSLCLSLSICLLFGFIHFKWTRIIFVDFVCGIREKKRLASYTHERIDRSELPCFYLNELTTLPLCDFVSLRRWKRKTFKKRKRRKWRKWEKKRKRKKNGKPTKQRLCDTSTGW